MSGGSLVFNNDIDIVVDNPIISDLNEGGGTGGGITKSGTGILTLPELSTFTGSFNLNSGTAVVTADSCLGYGLNSASLGGGTLSVTTGF
jgi:autotransporter-associated beta strand protein